MATTEREGLSALVIRERILASVRRGESVVNNIGNLGNLKPTAGLSMLEMSIITITWIGT